jgi:hypothetical protein
MAKNKNKTNDKYIINVPVFVSKRHSVGSLFELTFDNLIDGIIQQLKQYNDEKDYKILNKKNKLFQRQIGHINFEKCTIGDVPVLLLNASAYTINKQGEHIKSDTIVSIEPSDRIGDNSNYYLLVPEITGLDAKYYNWILLVYDDPTRDTEEIITIAKSIMNDIIHQPIKNIKLPDLLTELKDTFPKIKLQLNSIEYNENSRFDKFKKYETHFSSFTKKEVDYIGMPIDDVEKLIKDKFGSQFKQKVLKFFAGNKEYKIKQEIANFKADNNLLVERYFNFAEDIPTTQMNDVFKKEFILNIMKKVLAKYLTNGES